MNSTVRSATRLNLYGSFTVNKTVTFTLLTIETASECKTHCNYRQEAEMHPRLLKVKARMRCDRRKTCKSTFYIMSNQAYTRACLLRRMAKCGCPWSPAATAHAADTFSDDRTDAIRQWTCQGRVFACFGERFSASCRF